MDNENNQGNSLQPNDVPAPTPVETPVEVQADAPVSAPAEPAAEMPAVDAPVSQTVAEPVAQPAVPAQDPGKVLGIVGFALSFVGGGLVSIVLGAIAVSKSKKAGHTNGLAIAAIVLGSLGFIFGLWFWLVVIVATYGAISADASMAI